MTIRMPGRDEVEQWPMTNVELYEALRGSIPDDAARMIAEAFHPASELATKGDLVGVQGSLQLEIAGVREEIAGVRGEMKALPTMGVSGTVVAVVLKG